MSYADMDDFEIAAHIVLHKLKLNDSYDIQKCSANDRVAFLSHKTCPLKSRRVEVTLDITSWADIGPLVDEIFEDLMSKPDWCLLNTNLWDYWATVGGSLTKGAALAWLEVKGMKENGQ